MMVAIELPARDVEEPEIPVPRKEDLGVSFETADDLVRTPGVGSNHWLMNG